jgi:hypothetical protein
VGLSIDGGSVTSTSRIWEFGPYQTMSSVADLPDGCVIDRCHGYASRANNCSRIIALVCQSYVIVDCHFYCTGAQGVENQAVSGWELSGPGLNLNNLFVAGGENVFFGGATQAVAIRGLCVSDVTFRRCYFYKPYTWNQHHPTWDGVNVVAKNNFELKWGVRILVEQCILENFFAPDQNSIMNIKVSVGGNGATIVTTDFIFRDSKVIKCPRFMAFSPGDDRDVAIPTEQQTTRCTVRNVLVVGLNAPYTSAGAPASAYGHVAVPSITKLTLKNITACHHTPTIGGLMLNDVYNCTDTVIENCVFTRGGTGIKFGGTSTEGTSSLNDHNPGYIFRGNVIFGANSLIYPANNNYPPVASMSTHLEDSTNYDYRLKDASSLKGTAYGGGDPGANITQIEAYVEHVIDGDWN